MNATEIQSAIEAVVFAAKSPVEVKDLAAAFNILESEVEGILKAIEDRHMVDESGFMLCNTAGGFIFRTKPQWADYVESVCQRERVQPLSTAAIETLAIIAYKQPVTKAEIEKIRGVKCDHAINKLVEYELVKELGRLDAPGRPILLGTTEEFLRCFGVQGLEELPAVDPVRLEDFKAEAEEEVQLRLDV